MSSPIQPIAPLGSPGGSESARPAASAARGADFESHLRRGGKVVAALDAHGPPPEVMEEIAVAARTNEQLRANGQSVSYIQDEHSGKVTIELRGGDGALLRTLSVAEALDLAAGKR